MAVDEGGMMEPCIGNNCKIRDRCSLYSHAAETTHGWMDMDEGWTCPEWVKKDEPVVEKDEQEDLGLF